MQLPVKARMKFDALVDAETDAQDLVSSIMRRLAENQRALGTSSAAAAASIEHEIARQRDKLAVAQQKHRAAADMNARLKYFLQSLGDASLEDARTKRPKIEKGDTLAKAAMRIRLKIGSLLAERSRIESCGLPIEEVKEQAAAYVAASAERGRPKLYYGHGRAFSASFNALVEGMHAPRLDLSAALAWLDADATLRRLIEEIEAQPKPALALTAQVKAEKLAALDAALLTAEFEDEACIEASEEEGPVISRRADADPRAVLGLVINRSMPAAAKLERVRG